MNSNIFKILIFIIGMSLTVHAEPIIINPEDIKNVTSIVLPSGIEVNSDLSVFCEAGCDEVLPSKGNKKLWFLLAGLAVIPLLKSCESCCEEPPSLTPPSTSPPLFPPVSTPPAPVPEPSTIILLLIGILISWRHIKNGFNHTS